MREALFIKFFICIAPFLIKLAWLFILNSNLEEELSNRLGGITFGVDADGNYGYKKAGADTVTPFKKGATIGSVSASTSARLGPGNTTSLSINFSIPSNARLIGITNFTTSDDAFNIYQINSPSNVYVRNLRNSIVTANLSFTANYIIEE